MLGKVVIIFSIYASVVLSDEYTCCYGKTCPLPVFWQYGNYQFFIDNYNVIDEDACCPHTPFLASSGIDSSALWNGEIPTAETACRCKHAQTCDSGENMVDSDAYTCNGQCMTDSGCPDAYVRDCWWWDHCGHGEVDLNDGQGCITVGMYNYCNFNYAGTSRGMSQRCHFPETICIQEESGTLSGEYQILSGHYYGFPNYKGPTYYFHVERYASMEYDYGEPVWVFQLNEDYTVAKISLDWSSFSGSFDDVTNLSGYTVTFMGDVNPTYTITITEGQCVSEIAEEPTPYPTYYNSPYPTWANANINDKTYPPENKSETSNGMPTGIIIFIVAAGAVIVGVIFVTVCKRYSSKKSSKSERFISMDTLQN
eukprot:474504_1